MRTVRVPTFAPLDSPTGSPLASRRLARGRPVSGRVPRASEASRGASTRPINAVPTAQPNPYFGPLDSPTGSPLASRRLARGRPVSGRVPRASEASRGASTQRRFAGLYSGHTPDHPIAQTRGRWHRRRMAWVYILRCADGSLYIGHTDNVEDRERTHNESRGGSYTATRRPVQVVYSESAPSLDAARRRKRRLKRWSGQKKEALVAGNVQELKRLSRSHKPRRPTSPEDGAIRFKR